jgi:hypothetical protein
MDEARREASVGRNAVLDDGRVLASNSRFLVFSVLLAISFCTLLYFRTTYNPLSYNVFCSDRFTANGSRFTSFEPSMDGGRWTKWNVGRVFSRALRLSPSRDLNSPTTNNVICFVKTGVRPGSLVHVMRIPTDRWTHIDTSGFLLYNIFRIQIIWILNIRKLNI